MDTLKLIKLVLVGWLVGYCSMISIFYNNVTINLYRFYLGFQERNTLFYIHLISF